jgi:hypothetical protein
LGNIQLEIGCVVRYLQTNSKQIFTCYVRNVTPQIEIDGSVYLSDACLFQVKLSIEVPRDTLLEYPNAIGGLPEEEGRSLALLYSSHPIRAVGHGCDAVVKESVIYSQSLPVAEIPATNTDTVDSNGEQISVGMKDLAEWNSSALEAIDRLVAIYEAWIASLEMSVARLPEHHIETANKHLDRCRAFLLDIREGWTLAKSDSRVRQCLQWASWAMAEQQRSYRASARECVKGRGDELKIDPPTRQEVPEPRWRGFQIAFLLASIPPSVDLSHRRRSTTDVIWMPTGGGKTEAYLGLAAFVILWRRVNCSPQNREMTGIGDTTVLMRYTLRLLTAQQLQRTASLMCALEVLRKENRDQLGKRRFSVGAWLGSASTPNSHGGSYGAVSKFNEYKKKPKSDRPFLLNACPWCKCRFISDDRLHGYRVNTTANGTVRMQAWCPDPACPFNATSGLPVYEVDEDLYKRPPTIIVGTVDKFAMLAWRDDPRSFFGIEPDGTRNPNCPSPDLIIQDELHLISGPLGSLVGLYECGIESLFLHDDGHKPRVVAATATTRAYEAQAKQIFGSESVRLLPPPGLSIEDSFFARADRNLPPRIHVGVCATGLGRFTRSQSRVVASLSQAVGVLANLHPEASDEADYYWTNLAFFGSLRDLGTAKSMVSTDIGAYLWNIYRATGVTAGSSKGGKKVSTRSLSSVIELTSASSQSASESLSRLERRHSESGAADLALATSVIEVGVDVARLGLLTVIHQPKTAATYIQVSGRVGRSSTKGPGLVVVLLSPSMGRDVSHFERFTAFHSRLYEAVEPATVTPFTDAALERGLRGVVASVVRQTRSNSSNRVSEGDLEIAGRVVEQIANRAERLTGREAGIRVRTQWQVALEELRAAVVQNLVWGKANERSSQFLRLPGVTEVDADDLPGWTVLTSLRNVDSNAGTRIMVDWIRESPSRPLRIPGAAVRSNAESDHEEAQW